MIVLLARWLTLATVALSWSVSAQAATAPDPTRPGPYQVGRGSYTLSATLDRELSDEFKTQIAAAVWYPKNAPPSEPRPLLVLLAGNHATCGYFDRKLRIRVDDDTTYTYSGKCPKGYAEAPSHLGYAYLAERLAAWGYVVVSINANRGVNAAPDSEDDPSLILRRGRLILRHLEQLGTWNRTGGAPKSIGFEMRGQLDFANLGLFGHSRGGDAIVAAAGLLADKKLPWRRRLPPNTTIRGLFAIAPTDAQMRQLRPINTAYAVLLPMCDGDVSDLEGVHFFDRALNATREYPTKIKATIAVWGANHNYYNTEWQEADATGCVGHRPLFGTGGGSAAQRDSAVAPVLGFFRASVGRHANPIFGRILDSGFSPAAPYRDRFRIDRSWTRSPDRSLSWLLERFGRRRLTSTAGLPYQLTRIKAASINLPDHDEQGLAISWRGAAPAKPSALVVALAGKGRSIDMTGWSSLELRIAMGCGGDLEYPDCSVDPPVKDGAALKGDLRLVDADGRRSQPVAIGDYAGLFSPVGVDYEGYYFIRHPVLSTLRVPSAAFAGIDRTQVKAMELSFSQMAKAVVYLGDLRLSRAKATFPNGVGMAAPALAQAALDPTRSRFMAAAPKQAVRAQAVAERSSLSIRRGTREDEAGHPQPSIELVAQSDRPFPVTGNGMMLLIGRARMEGGSFTRPGTTDQIVFHLTPEEFAALADGAPVTLFGLASQPPWRLGALNKAAIQ